MQTTPTARPPVRRALALALACGAALLATAAAAARPTSAQPGAATHLELTPARGVAQREQSIRYTAVAVDANGRHRDVTALTNFRFKDAAPCRKVEIGTVRCDQEGTYHLTGEVDVPRLTSDEVELEVTYDQVPPRIESVDRDRSPPGQNLEVKGTTGTCTSTGKLRLDGEQRSSVPVAGKFTASLPIPPAPSLGTTTWCSASAARRRRRSRTSTAGW